MPIGVPMISNTPLCPATGHIEPGALAGSVISWPLLLVVVLLPVAVMIITSQRTVASDKEAVGADARTCNPGETAPASTQTRLGRFVENRLERLVSRVHTVQGLLLLFIREGGSAVAEAVQPRLDRSQSISPRVRRTAQSVYEVLKGATHLCKKCTTYLAKTADFSSGSTAIARIALRAKFSKVMEKLPGGEALLLLADYKGKVLEAVKQGGVAVGGELKNVVQSIVSKRRGPEAGEMSAKFLSIAGHGLRFLKAAALLTSAFSPRQFLPGPRTIVYGLKRAAAGNRRSE